MFAFSFQACFPCALNPKKQATVDNKILHDLSILQYHISKGDRVLKVMQDF